MPGPRLAAALALLALAPTAVYVLDRGDAGVISLSVVSVLLIAATLYLVFGPPEGGDHASYAEP